MIATYDRTIFKDESCGFRICGFHTSDTSVPLAARSPYFHDRRIHFTATGYLLPETRAIDLDLQGRWKKTKYGLQLAVESFREIPPSTAAGIVGYLSSGVIKGVGKKTAQAMVDEFGTDTLKVLETEPDRILSIRGISARKLSNIIDSYRATARLRETMEFLTPFGITANKCVKIQKEFGDNTIKILREKPFSLCRIHGFGFKTVDTIARKIGCTANDPARIQAALQYALEEASYSGHVFLPKTELYKLTLLLLNEQPEGEPPLPVRVSEKELAAQLYELAMGGPLHVEDDNVYMMRLYRAELFTAKAVAKLTQASVGVPAVLEKAMLASQSELGLMLSPRQCDAVRACFTNPVSIITGGPGTGKTTVLRIILDLYQKLVKGVVQMAAPTSIAARRMRETTGLPAGTLHSMLGLVTKKGDFYHVNGTDPLPGDFIVVDEMSMLDIELARELFARIRCGARVLLVGDANQLPSVGPGRVFGDLITSGRIPVTQLDVVFRQSGTSRIAINAQLIQQNRANLLYGPDFQFIPCENDQEAADVVLQKYVEEAKARGIGQVQVLTPFKQRGASCAKQLSLLLRDAVNPAATGVPQIQIGGQLFRRGDRVVQLHNSGNISNGDTGFISAIGTDPEDETPRFTLEFSDHRTVTYSPEDMETVDLAYAMTIHKSQGTEYATVIIPILSSQYIMLRRNLIYTAITRAKQRVILVGQKQAIYMAIHKNDGQTRNSLLAKRIDSLFSSMDKSVE